MELPGIKLLDGKIVRRRDSRRWEAAHLQRNRSGIGDAERPTWTDSFDFWQSQDCWKTFICREEIFMREVTGEISEGGLVGSEGNGVARGGAPVGAVANPILHRVVGGCMRVLIAGFACVTLVACERGPAVQVRPGQQALAVGSGGEGAGRAVGESCNGVACAAGSVCLHTGYAKEGSGPDGDPFFICSVECRQPTDCPAQFQCRQTVPGDPHAAICVPPTGWQPQAVAVPIGAGATQQ